MYVVWSGLHGRLLSIRRRAGDVGEEVGEEVGVEVGMEVGVEVRLRGAGWVV